MPNKYDDFFEEAQESSTDEATFEKLIAVKKNIVRGVVGTNNFQSVKMPISAQKKAQTSEETSNKEKNNNPIATQKKRQQKQKATSKAKKLTNKIPKNKKNTIQKGSPAITINPATHSSETPSETPRQPFKEYTKRPTFLTEKITTNKAEKNKKSTIQKESQPTPIHPTKQPAQKASLKTSPQQPSSEYAKKSTFLTNKAITENSQQSTVSKQEPAIKNKVTNTEQPTKQTNTMQPINSQTSANTYGGGTNSEGAHITDTPYVEKEIPIEGKNLIPRSQEVHDILSYVPNWMVRWGNTLIFLILGGILVMSYYIKYPDVVKGSITINSAYPPIPLVSKAAGAVTLLKQDKELVYAEEVIGIIKNTANYQDVLKLKEELVGFQDKLEKGWNFSYYELPKGLQLGELQSAYSNLFIKLKEKKIQHQSSSNDKTRKQNINQQLRELETIKKAKETSLSIKYQEYLKAKNLVDTRYKALYKKGSISAEQINAKESEVKNLLDRYQNDRMSFNEIKKRILDLSSTKVEIDFQKEDKQVLSESSLITAYESLKSSIQNWEDTYLLKAPVEGTLNFIQFTKSNMYLQQSQTIANIIPVLSEIDTSAVMIGELLMPTIGAGKATVGQVVNIALHDYPKKQYGIVEGKVHSIADVSIPIPDGQGMAGYKVLVTLPNGLENTMKKEIQFKHNMQGNAEIITEDIRLIERFFHELRDIIGAD